MRVPTIRSAYGRIIYGSENGGPGYAGHIGDQSSDLTYMKARYYDNIAMRFTSPDPVDVDPSSGGSFNRYWYGNNNPYKFVDPDGRLGRLADFLQKGMFGVSSEEQGSAKQQAARQAAATFHEGTGGTLTSNGTPGIGTEMDDGKGFDRTGLLLFKPKISGKLGGGAGPTVSRTWVKGAQNDTMSFGVGEGAIAKASTTLIDLSYNFSDSLPGGVTFSSNAGIGFGPYVGIEFYYKPPGTVGASLSGGLGLGTLIEQGRMTVQPETLKTTMRGD